jgi:gamma-tubulin complex component 4
MRVRYQGLPSGTTISVLAQQSSGGFAPYTASNGYSVALAAIGNHTAADLIQRQRQVEALTTWILRGVGWLLIFAGFAAFMAPLSAIASFVPILGGLVRGAVGGFAFVLSVPMTVVVIALAWIFYRPLLGGGLLLAAALLAGALWLWHHRRTAARVATAAAPPAERAPA